jgi:hypothetical protein
MRGWDMNVFIAGVLAFWLLGALLFCLALCAAAAGPTPAPPDTELDDFAEEPPDEPE